MAFSFREFLGGQLVIRRPVTGNSCFHFESDTSMCTGKAVANTGTLKTAATIITQASAACMT